MASNKTGPIDEYIAAFPQETQLCMQQIRATIKSVIPHAEESISYNMPCFSVEGKYIIYFAGYKNHIGVYPAPVGNDAFTRELSNYKTGRGSVQFPLGQPMPLDLITRIVEFRVKEQDKTTGTPKKASSSRKSKV